MSELDKKGLKRAEEFSKLAPKVNAFLGRLNAASNPPPLPNRQKARELGFDNVQDLKNSMLREQAKQEIIERRKTEIIDEWFVDKMRKYLSDAVLRWAGKSKWRLGMFGFRLGVGESWDLEHNCPVSICRIWRFFREVEAVQMAWGNDDKEVKP